MFNWAEDTNCAITACDTEGVVIFMNKQSILVNGDMRGKNMLPCHNERSRGIIDRLIKEGGTNAYTIDKKGVRKMIYQTAWRHEDGTVGGLLEISMPIPAEMPHYIRG
ncbi:MAG TPA: PAS sensor protein [Candidatus Alistipes avicola]|uniref:PAS sensor protein n=1 Tax=Candidatus Alistipes avicola TaxID=2838432 RepID=A0A9D2RKH6_9BACT|nr:PAS sensor protein [uncultured Alistipes sp.]HJA99379.1 PAS sensor protein [Candidatus Alistipes avicola]